MALIRVHDRFGGPFSHLAHANLDAQSNGQQPPKQGFQAKDGDSKVPKAGSPMVSLLLRTLVHTWQPSRIHDAFFE